MLITDNEFHDLENLYNIFEIEKSCTYLTETHITNAKRIYRSFHPDKNKENGAFFPLYQESYDLLLSLYTAQNKYNNDSFSIEERLEKYAAEKEDMDNIEKLTVGNHLLKPLFQTDRRVDNDVRDLWFEDPVAATRIKDKDKTDLKDYMDYRSLLSPDPAEYHTGLFNHDEFNKQRQQVSRCTDIKCYTKNDTWGESLEDIYKNNLYLVGEVDETLNTESIEGRLSQYHQFDPDNISYKKINHTAVQNITLLRNVLQNKLQSSTNELQLLLTL